MNWLQNIYIRIMIKLHPFFYDTVYRMGWDACKWGLPKSKEEGDEL